MMDIKIILIGTTSILGIYFIIQFFIVFWLWFFHDRPIKHIHEELLNVPRKINETYKGRGATRDGIEPFIRAEEKRFEIKLKKRELGRKLFLDRAHLISLFKIKS